MSGLSGRHIYMGYYHTLTLHWDGTAWTMISEPERCASNMLTAVTAAGPNDVWAIGVASIIASYSTLVLHWDGSSWTLHNPKPYYGTDDNFSFGAHGNRPGRSLGGRQLCQRQPGAAPDAPLEQRSMEPLARSPGGDDAQPSTPSPALAPNDLWAVWLRDRGVYI